jgi:hypothetical protein
MLDALRHSPVAESSVGTQTLLGHFRQITIDGLLSTAFITSPTHSVLLNLAKEIDWLLEWRAQWVSSTFAAAEERERAFLAPVTFQQTILSLRGVLGLATTFFAECPTAGLVLRRVNQSRLESFFGRIRQTGGGSRVITAQGYRSAAGKVALLEEERLFGDHKKCPDVHTRSHAGPANVEELASHVPPDWQPDMTRVSQMTKPSDVVVKLISS